MFMESVDYLKQNTDTYMKSFFYCYIKGKGRKLYQEEPHLPVELNYVP